MPCSVYTVVYIRPLFIAQPQRLVIASPSTPCEIVVFLWLHDLSSNDIPSLDGELAITLSNPQILSQLRRPTWCQILSRRLVGTTVQRAPSHQALTSP